jgi:hypothetical protein
LDRCKVGKLISCVASKVLLDIDGKGGRGDTDGRQRLKELKRVGDGAAKC